MRLVPLKRIAAINLRTLPETTDADFEFRYVDIGAVGRGRIVSEPEANTFASAPSRARRVVQQGDTIISTVRTYLRAVWPVRDITTDLIASTGFAVLTPSPCVDPRYLGWLAQSDVLVEEVVARSVGVSYPAINPSDIGTVRVPVPALANQLAIADFLDAETAHLDALVEKRRRMIELLEQRTSSCLDQLIRPDDLLVPLRRLAAVQGGVTVDSGRRVTNGVRRPYLRVANVQDGYLDLSQVVDIEVGAQEAARATLRSGDVLMTEANGNSMNLGRGTVWSDEVPNCLHQNHVFAIRPLRSRLLPELLALLTQSLRGRSYFQLVSSQVGIATISKQKVLEFPVPFIPLVEQRNRVQAVERQLSKIRDVRSVIERQVALLLEKRQALITAAVTEDLEIPEAAA